MVASTRRLVAASFLSLIAVFGGAATASAAVPFQSIGVPAGPLSTIGIGNELGCQVQHISDVGFSFYPEASPGDCGTFAFVDGTLYAPNFALHTSTTTVGIGAYTAFTPVSQPIPSGAGTPADPRKVVTTVALGGTGVQIVQTDTYIAGQEYYSTQVALNNTAGVAKNAVLYRAGDCTVPPLGTSFGFSTAANGAGCSVAANNTPAGRIVALTPQSAGATFTEDSYSLVWAKIGSHTAFVNDCAKCANLVDSGIGISWALTVPAGGTVSRASAAGVSPTGIPPPAQPDADSDGVPDAQDACPTVAGTGPNGCPPSPPNNFTIGKPKLNKKKGTATLSVVVPGPGDLSLAGKDVKPQRPILRDRGGGASPKPVAGAGTVELIVKATGKAKKKLKKKGKVKVTPTLTFTPTGGLPATQTTVVKLKLKS